MLAARRSQPPDDSRRRDRRVHERHSDARETPLHRAAAFGTETTVQALLDAGARRDVTDVGGETPLTWASWHLRPPAILRRLCYGAFAVHPGNDASYDHGTGWGQIDPPHMARPVLS